MTKINPNQGFLFPKWMEEDLLDNQGERIPDQEVAETIRFLEVAVLRSSAVASAFFQQPSLREDVLPDFDFTTWRSLRDPTPPQDPRALLENFSRQISGNIDDVRVKQMLYELNPASIKSEISQDSQAEFQLVLKVLQSFKTPPAHQLPAVVCVDRMPELSIVGKSKVSSRPEFVFDSKQIAQLCREARKIKKGSEISRTNSQYLAIMAGIALHEHNVDSAKSRLYLKKAYVIDANFLNTHHDRFIERAYRVFYASQYIDKVLELKSSLKMQQSHMLDCIASSLNNLLLNKINIRSEDVDFVLKNSDEMLSYRK